MTRQPCAALHPGPSESAKQLLLVFRWKKIIIRGHSDSFLLGKTAISTLVLK